MQTRITMATFLALMGLAGCDRGSIESFAQQVANCQSASFTAARVAGARGRYSVEGPADEGCWVSFSYEENPNPTWEDKPFSFVLDPEGDVEEQLRLGVAECLEGRNGPFQCEGPLFIAVGG